MSNKTTALTPEEKAQFKRSDKLIDDLFKRIGMMDDDPLTTCYGVFVSMIHYLAEAGWTAEELMKDVKDHVEIHLSDGTNASSSPPLPDA